MRILYLTDEFPPHSYGGSGTIAKYIAQGVAARGHQVFVVSTAKHIHEEREEPFGDGKIFWLPQYNSEYLFRLGLRNPKSLEALEHILKKVQPDVVHAHNMHWHLSYAALALARQYTPRVFLTAHDLTYVAYAKVFPKGKRCTSAEEAAKQCKASLVRDLRAAKIQYLPWRNHVIHGYLSNVRLIFCVSDFLKKALEANGIKRYVLLHNGIAFEKFSSASGDIREFCKSKGIDSPHVVFFGGRLGSAKGLLALLDALVIVRKKFPDVLLLVAAREGERKEVEREAMRRGISASIRYTGWLDAQTLPLAYAASAMVATPSIYFDPFPTVNLEAMAARRPVVGTCFGGTHEAVEDGVTGFVVNPHDIASFADKISRLLYDQNLNRAMGEAGYERLQKEFSLERQVQKILDAYIL